MTVVLDAVVQFLVGLPVLAACFGLAWSSARLGEALALRGYRKLAPGAPWVERARWSFPARSVVLQNFLLAPLALGGAVALRVAPGLGLAPVVWGMLAGLAAGLGASRVLNRLEWRLAGGGRPGRGVTVRGLLVTPVLATVWLMLGLVPHRWGWPAAGVIALGAGLMTAHAAGGLAVVLRWLGRAHPASPRLAAAVDRAAASMGVRPRAVWELDSPNANALVWPSWGLVVFTRPALEVLDDDGLAAVAAHELGHLSESPAVFLSRLAGPYLVVASVAGIPLAGSYGLGVGLGPPVVMIAGLTALAAVARRMEVRSDRLATSQEGTAVAAGAYARALAAIYEHDLIPAVTRARRPVHPHLYDRLTAAGSPPDYPRPEPPPRDRVASLPLVALLIGCFWLILSAVIPPADGPVPLLPAATAAVEAVAGGAPGG